MSVSPTSKKEAVIYRTSEVLSEAFVRSTAAPALVNAVQMAGQACLNNPPLVVAGALGAIATKELVDRVAPHVRHIADPVIKITQEYPKTTALSASLLCCKSLPWAATGEPTGVVVAGIACSATAMSLLGYLINGNPKESEA